MRQVSSAEVVVGELGEIRLWVDGDEQSLRGARTKSVLAFLALSGHRGVSLDYLVETVWRDHPTRGRSSLANVIARIRAIAGSDAVVTHDGTYRLASHVDSHRARLLEAADRATAGEVADILDLTDAVEDSWRGVPWTDFDDEEALVADRVVLRDARARLIARAAMAAKDLGELDIAIGHLRTLIAERPHHERWWCELADAVGETGDRVGALRLLQTARDVLTQAGLSAGPDLIRAEQRILGVEEPADRPCALIDRRGNPSLRVAQDLPFVGRDTEIGQLVEAQQPAQLLGLVEGSAGAGKSRLVVEAARQCIQRTVLSGRCVQDGRSPFAPVSQIFADLTSAFPIDSLRMAMVGLEESVAGFVAGKTPSSVSGDRSPEVRASQPRMGHDRERLAEALATVLARASTGQPLLVVIDDLQWASDVVLNLVEALTTRSAGDISVLATCRYDRPAEANRLRLLELCTRVGGRHLDLGPLPTEGVERLIAVSGSQLSVRAVERRTGGNPFFVAQLLSSGAGTLDESTLAYIVRARVELVDRHAGPFLTAAALCGLDFDPWLVGNVLEFDAEKTGNLIDRLAHQRLILCSDGDTTNSFTHGLVAEAMVASLESAERYRLNLRIAECEQQRGSPIEDWVDHAVDAGPLVHPPVLAEWAVRGAERLINRAEPDRAAALLDRVLERQLAPSDRVQAMVWRARAGQALGAYDEPLLLAASDIAIEAELTEGLADVALAYSARGPWRHHGDTNGPRLLATAIERCPHDRPDLLAQLEARLACFSIFSGPLDDRVTAAKAAIDKAAASGNYEAIAHALNSALVAVASPAAAGQTRDIEIELRRLEDAGLARSEMMNRPEIHTYWSADGAQYRLDLHDRQDEREGATYADRQTLNVVETVAAIHQGELAAARGLLAEHVQDSDDHQGINIWNTVMVEWLDGDAARAIQNVQDGYDAFRGAPMRYTLLWLAIESGDEVLTDELMETISPKRIQRLPELFLGGFGLAGLAMAATLSRDRDLAALVDAELARIGDQMLGVPWASFPSAPFFRSLMASTCDLPERAKQHASAARRIHDRMIAPAYNGLLTRYVALT